MTILKAASILSLSIVFSAASFANFDHSHKEWDQILKSHISKKSGQALFDYRKLRGSDSELKKFKGYLKRLSAVSKESYDSFSIIEKFTFLVNAYNAFTVELILDNYPLKSIRDIGFLPGAAWRKDFFKLLGRDMDLGHIEHEILRKDFNEPRLHFAINCASIGCPNLQKEAYTPSNLEALLSKAETEFFQQKEKNYIDTKNKKVFVSKIFDWFGDDFTQKYGSLKKYLAKAFSNEKVINDNFKIKFTDYDWALNSHENEKK